MPLSFQMASPGLSFSGGTDFGRGLDSANRIAGHALNVFYADGTATKVFAPQENVFMQR